MIDLCPDDLAALQRGLPPQNADLIRHLCIRHNWLQLMQDYCLAQVIGGGGSKVKILYGSRATGKSHYLQFFKVNAEADGYFTVYLNLKEAEFYLSDPVQLYKALAAEFNTETLQATLSEMILKELGYQSEDYLHYSGQLNSFLCERENANPEDAKRQIRMAINHVINQIGVDFSFRKFLHIFSEAVVEKDAVTLELTTKWLKGEKIERLSKVQSSLYETLNKSNARIWLYSLTELILLSGYKGLLVLIDQLEAILPHAESQMRYTPMRRNDVYELLRQLIDDLDFFHHTLFLIAGDADIMESERYGLQSYHALWMRIQPGFARHEELNPYADLIDADMILAEASQKGELSTLSKKLKELSQGFAGTHPETNFMTPESYPDFRYLLLNYLNPDKIEESTDE